MLLTCHDRAEAYRGALHFLFSVAGREGQGEVQSFKTRYYAQK